MASSQTTPGVMTPIINRPGGGGGGGGGGWDSTPGGAGGPSYLPSSAPPSVGTGLGVARAGVTPLTPPALASPGSPRHHPSGTVDVDALIRTHAGDVRRTLDAVVNDRNSLQSQNTQLWKLIEKQRAQCAHLAADNDRLRADRERANGRLVAAGLEPVAAPNRRVPHSASALGLGAQEAASGRSRQLSDSESTSGAGPNNHTNKPTTPGGLSSASTTMRSTSEALTPTEATGPTVGLLPSGMPPSVSENSGLASKSTLLPSPMPEKRLRHESRMTFPPEVASFMALADVKDRQLSSSLSAEHHGGSGLGGEPSTTYHTPSPDASARASPIAEMSEELAATSPRPSQDTVTSRPSISPAVDPRPSIESTTIVSPTSQPDHLVMTPALLPHTRLSIPHSTVIPNQSGRDVLCFIVQVQVRPPNAQPLQWTVGKTFSAFMDLDQRTQERSGKNRKDWKRMVTPLPEGKAWKDFAPSKIDQRKGALEHYIESLLVAPVSDKSDLCNFLSTDVVQAKVNKQRKEGYLTKKGKNFGGWKTRYFILEGPIMKYYETRGGQILGTIQILGAQIGRQNRAPDSSDDRNFRHAFLIIEANTKKDASRHVLCAGSDMERDSWIEMLVRQVEPEPVVTSPVQTNAPPNPMSAGLGHQRRRSAIRKSSKDIVVSNAQPMSSLPDANAKFMSGAPLPSVINMMESQRHMVGGGGGGGATSGSNGGGGGNGGNGGGGGQGPINREASTSSNSSGHPASTVSQTSPDIVPPLSSDGPTPKPVKRSSAMPGRQSFSPAYLSKLSNDGISSVPGYPVDRERDRKAKSGRFWGFGKAAGPEKGAAQRPVFGVPLPDSIAIASVAGLPAIVFRCIEYLEAKQADQEEGIYRLSGSSAVIKGLKERFNHEGDVNLLQMDERWDPHAIAGLLKTYLRELPTSLLTRELHIRFLAVIDLVDSAARVAELSRLVAELPPANYTLLRAFTAHLILIVRNSAVNKMTLRNIGIVFSPTLGIPAGIFYELVSRFGAIFDDEGYDELPLDEVSVQATATGGLQVPDAGVVSDDPAKSKRNSMLYHASGADAMLGLAGRALEPSAEDSTSELSLDDIESDVQSSDNLSLAPSGNASVSGAATGGNGGGGQRNAAYGEDVVEALVGHNGADRGE